MRVLRYRLLHVAAQQSRYPIASSFIIWRHFIVYEPYQRDSHLGIIIAPKYVADEVCLDLHCNLISYNRVSRSYVVTCGSVFTISKAPLRTPHRMFEYQSSSCARPSSGSSTKSARGLSSKMRENCLLSLVQLVTVGVMLRKILNPTWEEAGVSYRTALLGNGLLTLAIVSAVSLKLAQEPVFDFARKSSIRRCPMLYPILSSWRFTSR
jgi:hypothetical protein